MAADLSRVDRIVGSIYDELPPYLAEQSRYLNLGFWRDQPRTQDEASEALTCLLGETAGFQADDAVLDVGFGLGEQDVFWLHHFGLGRIVGLNVAAWQVELARRYVDRLGLADRIDLRLGSATALPFAGPEFDHVVANECACHFHTRDDFFREAFRVLRPGGTLATTDVIPIPPPRSTPHRWLHRLVLSGENLLNCQANLYPRDVYASKMRAAGFVGVDVVSIREDVYRPLARHLAAEFRRGVAHWPARLERRLLRVWDPATRERLRFLVTQALPMVLLVHPITSPVGIALFEHNPFDYVVAVGHKPGSVENS